MESVDAPLAVVEEVEVLGGESALAAVLVLVDRLERDRLAVVLAHVAVVGDAGLRRLLDLAQLAEGEESIDLIGGLVPAAEDRPGVSDVAVPVQPHRLDAPVRLLHSDCRVRTHFSVSPYGLRCSLRTVHNKARRRVIST